MNKFFSSFNIYTAKPVLQVGVFGFVSGLALLLSGNTLNFWLAQSGVNKATIGLFSLVALPYIAKILIAPLVDRIKPALLPSILPTKKIWILFANIALVIFLVILGNCDVRNNYLSTAIAAFLVALAAIVQDIVLDALRVEILGEKHRAAGSVIHTVGYRIGTIISGAGAVYLSAYYSWSFIYNLMASLVFILGIVMLNFEFPKKAMSIVETVKQKITFYNVFVQPISMIGSKKELLYFFLLILFYRLADNLIIVMINPFLLDLGFATETIAIANKFCGYLATIIGGLVAGIIMMRKPLYSVLYDFAILGMIAHMFLISLVYISPNVIVLSCITFFSAFCGGMSLAAYITFITSLCIGPNIATQYAFFSSIMGLSRVVIPAAGGFVVNLVGWSWYFSIVTLVTIIPSLWIIRRLTALKADK